MGLEFNRTNSAIEAFNNGMKAANERRAADIRYAQDSVNLDESSRGVESRLSRLKADSRIATSAADVAEANKGANIRIAYNAADRGGLENQSATVDLNEKRATSAPRVAAQNTGYGETVQTSPSRVGATVATNTATAEEAPLGTQQKRTEVGVGAATAPYRVEQAKNQTRVGSVGAQIAELEPFKEAMKLIAAGRIEEGREIARRSGVELPDEVVNNTTLTGMVATIIADAERTYPNSPQKQQEAINKQTLAAVEQLKQGKQATTPDMTTLRTRTDGLPTPPATGGKVVPPALQQNVDFLISRGAAKDTNDALRVLNQGKTDPTQLLKDLYASEYKIRTDAAKGPGGYGVVDNAALAKADAEAMAAAQAKLKAIKETVASIGNIPLPPSTGAATAAVPTTPAPAPAPAAAPAKPAQQPGTLSKIMGYFGYGGGVPDPTTPPAVTPPAAAPAPAAPKMQDRLGEVTPEKRAIANGATPDQIKEAARRNIAAGADRVGVLIRLQQLGIDTTGL